LRQKGQESLGLRAGVDGKQFLGLPEFLLPYLARQCEGRGPEDLLFGGEDGGHLKRPHPVSEWFATSSRACRGRRPTIFDTLWRASRWRLARTSKRCRRCSGTPLQQ
jgi:hypothetical protein